MADAELFDHIDHEHTHLTRLFTDVHQTFEKVLRGELSGPERTEALESASEDLKVALDDMLEHFSEEEEVLFVEIEAAFPELSDAIGKLVENHESICNHTRWLHGLLARSPEAIETECEKALDVLETVRNEVEHHSEDEQRIYNEALRKLPPVERRRLLKTLQSI